jgi:hypothetical protein
MIFFIDRSIKPLYHNVSSIQFWRFSGEKMNVGKNLTEPGVSMRRAAYIQLGVLFLEKERSSCPQKYQILE